MLANPSNQKHPNRCRAILFLIVVLIVVIVYGTRFSLWEQQCVCKKPLDLPEIQPSRLFLNKTSTSSLDNSYQAYLKINSYLVQELRNDKNASANLDKSIEWSRSISNNLQDVDLKSALDQFNALQATKSCSVDSPGCCFGHHNDVLVNIDNATKFRARSANAIVLRRIESVLKDVATEHAQRCASKYRSKLKFNVFNEQYLDALLKRVINIENNGQMTSAEPSLKQLEDAVKLDKFGDGLETNYSLFYNYLIDEGVKKQNDMENNTFLVDDEESGTRHVDVDKLKWIFKYFIINSCEQKIERHENVYRAAIFNALWINVANDMTPLSSSNPTLFVPVQNTYNVVASAPAQQQSYISQPSQMTYTSAPAQQTYTSQYWLTDYIPSKYRQKTKSEYASLLDYPSYTTSSKPTPTTSSSYVHNNYYSSTSAPVYSDTYNSHPTSPPSSLTNYASRYVPTNNGFVQQYVQPVMVDDKANEILYYKSLVTFKICDKILENKQQIIDGIAQLYNHKLVVE